MLFEYRGVQVTHPEDMPQAEAKAYVEDQINLVPSIKLVAMDLSIDGKDVVIQPHYNTVNRVRRITGYLSTIKNFNDAKKAEEHDRIVHVKCS